MEMNKIELNDKNLNNNNNSDEYKRKDSILEILRKYKHYERILISIKYIILILCIIGLTVQTILLLTEFYSGETVVKTTFENPELHDFPAITVCFPILIPFKKLVEINPKLDPIYEEYMNYFFNNSSNDDMNKPGKNERILKKFNDIYNLELNDLYNSSDLHVTEFIDTITIPYKLKCDNNDHKYSVSVNAIKVDGSFDNYTNPIESVIWDPNIELKCYTFLTEQNSDYNKDSIKLVSIKLEITNDKSWAYFKERIYQFIISLHSPKYIPYKLTFNNLNILSIENNYFIKFNKIKTKLLKKPYLTNCVDYNLNGVNSEKTRSDCMINCLYSDIEDKCKLCDTDCSKCFANLFIIFLRNSLLKNIDKKNFCPLNDCLLEKFLVFENECKTKCLNECEYEYIDYNIEKLHAKTINDLNSKLQTSTIFITPGQLPDQLVEHMPPMSPTSFISNFGGLLGMWLGLSALAVFETFIKYLDTK